MGALAALLLLLACQGRELTQNIAKAWDDCSPPAIEAAAATHGLQLVFDPCGPADLRDGAWSPDGKALAFTLGVQGYRMDGQTQAVEPLPLGPLRAAAAAWLSPTRLAALAEEADTLVLLDAGGLLTRHPLPLAQVRAIAPAEDAGAIYLFATDSAGAPAAYHLTLATDQLRSAPEQSPPAFVAAARRAIADPRGRWLAVEAAGPAIPKVDPRYAAQEPELLRRLPPASLAPTITPLLLFVDTQTQAVYRWDAVQGEAFAWYGGAPGWAAFTLWGFDGAQVRRNLVLTDLGPRLDALAAGQALPGFRRLD